MDMGEEMTKQEIIEALGRIRDGILDQDSRHGIEGMCEDITSLMWKINTKVEDF